MKMDLVIPTSSVPKGNPAGVPQTPPAGSSTPSVEDRSTAFRAVEGGNQLQSGEKLLVEAYAAIWVILFALVLFSWRRQRRLDERMSTLSAEIEKARGKEGR